MKINTIKDLYAHLRVASDPPSGRRNTALRQTVLSRLGQLGMDVDDNNLLSELNDFDDGELLAILGLFGLLGYLALLGFLSTQEV